MRLPERDNYSYHRDKMHAEPGGQHGRPRGRGADLRPRQGLVGRLVGHPVRHRAWRATWSPSGACPTSSARCSTRSSRKATSATAATQRTMMLGRDQQADRRRDPRAGRRRARARDRRPQDAGGQAPPARPGAARVRDADRRRDQAAARERQDRPARPAVRARRWPGRCAARRSPRPASASAARRRRGPDALRRAAIVS